MDAMGNDRIGPPYMSLLSTKCWYDYLAAVIPAPLAEMIWTAWKTSGVFSSPLVTGEKNDAQKIHHRR